MLHGCGYNEAVAANRTVRDQYPEHGLLMGLCAVIVLLRVDLRCGLLPQMFVIMFEVFLIFAFGRCYNCAPCLEFEYYWGDPGRFLKHFAHSVI